MKATVITVIIVGVVLYVVFFTANKRFDIGKPPKQRLLEDEIDIIKLDPDWANPNNRPGDFKNLDPETYARNIALWGLIHRLQITIDDLDDKARLMVKSRINQIGDSGDWFEAVESQVGDEYANIDDAKLGNAAWVVGTLGFLNLLPGI